MKAIIIDDERLARQELRNLLAAHKEIEVIAECNNAQSAKEKIAELNPDVIFLDIQMPQLTGLQISRIISKDIKVIFTTAYPDFALEGFELNAVDYLLKPINPNELSEAVKRFSKTKEKLQNYAILKENIKHDTIKKIAVPTGNSLIFLETDTIVCIKGEGAYSEIICSDGNKHLVSRNLKNFEDIMCIDNNFVRNHKSYIVNTNFITAYNKSDGGSLELKNGMQLPISLEKVQLILEAIEIIKR